MWLTPSTLKCKCRQAPEVSSHCDEGNKICPGSPCLRSSNSSFLLCSHTKSVHVLRYAECLTMSPSFDYSSSQQRNASEPAIPIEAEEKFNVKGRKTYKLCAAKTMMCPFQKLNCHELTETSSSSERIVSCFRT